MRSIYGYIVIVFSVTICACVYVCLSVCTVCKLFSVKSFLGTTIPRILKLGTNIEYDLFYCVRENQHLNAYHSLYLSICFSPVKFFVAEKSQSL